MSSMNAFASPLRPIPQFFNDCDTFTTKKVSLEQMIISIIIIILIQLPDPIDPLQARYNSTPCPKKVPPRPPSKSVPPISRLFRRPNYQSAQAISFKDNSDTCISLNFL